jgi:3-carboxy-cis,cis-muconate cycloisomerase
VAEHTGLFGGVFSRGAADTGSHAWLRAMLDTEAALARALERAGLAPAGTGAAVTAAAATAPFDPDALGQRAALAGNPVPGLVAELRKAVPADAADTVHRGATSQDIMDTAAMLLARGALDQLARDLAAAAGGCATLAASHRDTIMIGRTLLQQAVPVTFGMVAAGWLTSLDEAADAVARVRSERLAVQFGGAAGTLASLGADGPTVAGLLAQELGLHLPVLPWHTDRSRVIGIAAACAAAAAALAKIARDVTLFAQTEVGEVREGGAGSGERRGGSSAMPHKQNPVAAIAILGCTRRVPGLVATLVAAAEQEQQRAAGAWHAEWEPFADLLRVTGSAAAWGAELTGGLVVDPARMRANLDATGGLPLAERVAGLLAPALGRAQAHELVARASAHAVAVGVTLREALLGVPELAGWLDGAGVTSAQIDEALDPAGYLGSAGTFTDAALAAHARRSLPSATESV